jgi:serine/threonine protein kinase
MRHYVAPGRRAIRSVRAALSTTYRKVRGKLPLSRRSTLKRLASFPERRAPGTSVCGACGEHFGGIGVQTGVPWWYVAPDPSFKPEPATLASRGTPEAAPSSQVTTQSSRATTAAQTPFTQVDAAPPRVPTEGLPRYEALELLGEGGMGEVRLYKDALIGREVALKAIKPGHGSRSDLRMRFLREARVQGQLEHPAIVPVYDLSLGPEPAFFTMKRVRGVTLESVIDRLAHGDAEAVSLYSRRKLLTAFNSVCLAVDFAHAHGVVHRDLKPANVMLGDFGEVYVLDWGVAKLSDETEVAAPAPIDVDDAAAKTEAGALMGTVGYMSPEQARGAAADARSDVYSLGATLFEILALAPLHVGPTGSALMASTLGRVEARLSVRAAERAVPPELDTICVKATELAPVDRYASARELHDAIERFLDGDRDVELRRALAIKHARTAKLAKERALKTAGGDRESAIQEGFGEVGRALALDPNNDEALRAAVELRVLAPRTLPQEAQAELKAARDRTFRESAKAGVYALLSSLLYLPAALWMGVRDWEPIVILYVLILAAAGASYLAVRYQLASLSYVVTVLAAGAFGCLSRVFGPFMLLPSALVACVAGFSIDPYKLRRRFGIVCCCLAMIAPWALEWVGVLDRSYVFERGTITILPHALSLQEGPSMLLLLSVSVGTILSCGLLVGRVRTALEWAEHRAHLQTWQLRQLVPDAARGAAEATSAESPSECVP